MEELIFFVIFIVLSLLRSLSGRQQPARPGRPATPPAWPDQDLPDLLETVLRPPAAKVHGRREVSLRKLPVPPPDVMEPVVEASFVQTALNSTTEEEGEPFFQLDRSTILLGLVFSEILNEPRARHRRFGRSPR